MNSEIFTELKGNGPSQPVFEGLQVQAELRESLAITTINQSYRNAGTKNIEAVYTFPLPLDAVLLEMIVILGDKTLKGTVLPKQEAEEKYEEAITDGDAPVMLQNPQPGVYTMNVGNLLPGERAQITVRYGMFQRWQGDTLRYHLPTTIAPRYGSAETAGVEAHQEPETSLLVDNLFTFDMKILGTLAGMAIESPSHEIVVERNAEGKESRIRLVRKSAFMDRDLVLTVRKSRQQSATALMVNDGDEYLAWACFQPQFGLIDDPAPRSVKIVVDCSGSMAGDSNIQARSALLRIMDELRPQDWFNIVAFGSTAKPLFNAQTKADRDAISYARGFLHKLAADMGGTEIGNALEMAARLRCPEKIEQDILLITDGEVWDWEQVVTKAQKSKHRFFTVGVGSSVSEAFVRTLAERTGGACELVSPNENMAERIHRHFKRIGNPRSTGNQIVWPGQPLRVFPEQMPNVFDGDTCNQFAWYAAPPSGEVCLQFTLPDGTPRSLETGIMSLDDDSNNDAIIPRMAAALKLREIDDEEHGQELALHNQLVSRWTNYLAIMVREDEDKAGTLPELHKVQQMLAAGWGGTGSISYMRGGSLMAEDEYHMPMFLRKSADSGRMVSMEEPTILYQSAPSPPPRYSRTRKVNHQNTLTHFMKTLDSLLVAGIMPATIHLPELPAEIEEILKQLVAEGYDERTVSTVFLHCLVTLTGGDALSRQTKRIISKAFKELTIDRHALRDLEDKIGLELLGLHPLEIKPRTPNLLRRIAQSVGMNF